MRATPIFAVVAFVGVASPAQAQTPLPRAVFGPVVRYESVRLEGSVHHGTAVYGLGVAVRVTKHTGLAFDVTGSQSDLAERTYEGPTISFAPPGSTREEIERLAIWHRVHLTYRPQMGVSGAFTAGGQLSPRVGVQFRAGIAMRQYAETDSRVVTKIPEGVDPSRVGSLASGAAGTRLRGGLQFGLTVPVALTPRFEVRPEIGAVLGPVRIGNRYQVFTSGIQAVWSF